MAIKRELQDIHIYVGLSDLNDSFKARFKITDDVEGTVSYQEKEINVGAQVRAALAPTIAMALEKLTNDTRTVTRPLPSE